VEFRLNDYLICSYHDPQLGNRRCKQFNNAQRNRFRANAKTETKELLRSK